MNIVITGATGFLGKYVVRGLEKTHRLVLLGTDIHRMRATFGEKYTCFETDYTSDDLETKIGALSVDAVVHLAAKRISENGLLSEYNDNIRITEQLLRFCDTHRVGRMIMASSQSIYRNGLNTPPFREEDAYAQGIGKNYGYAYSKYICEQIGHFYQTPMISLRLGQLIGWGEKEGFMFMTQLRKVMNDEPIVLWGKGGGGRDYLYCKDAVGAIQKALELPHPQTEVYNISMGTPVSFRMFAENLVAVFGNEHSAIEYDTTKTEDTSVRYMSLEKASAQLGWKPQYDLRQTFIDMKNEYELYHH